MCHTICQSRLIWSLLRLIQKPAGLHVGPSHREMLQLILSLFSLHRCNQCSAIQAEKIQVNQLDGDLILVNVCEFYKEQL